MDVLHIRGGVPLEGRVRASGAKNAVTKILIASLISDQPCTIYNVPHIDEVKVAIDLCQHVGAEIHWDRQMGVIEIVTKTLKSLYIPQHFSGSNRLPILMIGALLGRTDEDIIVPTAGGCKIGKRPVDFHIEALEKLGAVIEYREMKKEGAYLARAHQGLKGTIIHLKYPSVGATENTILAAIRAKGSTIIHNAATEPEILDLILFLQKTGANISIDADRTIRIAQTTRFYPVEHTVITDRLEAASLGMAAISTQGKVFVEGANQQYMVSFLQKLREVGAGFTVKNDGIEFFYQGPLQGGLVIETDVYPGFATDWQQPFAVLLTQANGFSIIHETVYENRFGYTHTLNEMGANTQLFTHCLGSTSCRYKNHDYHHSLLVKGITPLVAKEIAIPDLRAGFAYVMAGLLAEGETVLSGLAYLDRGYENLAGKLSSLGADIERKQSSTNALQHLHHMQPSSR